MTRSRRNSIFQFKTLCSLSSAFSVLHLKPCIVADLGEGLDDGKCPIVAIDCSATTYRSPLPLKAGSLRTCSGGLLIMLQRDRAFGQAKLKVGAATGVYNPANAGR